jgi:hypothetical protein
MYEHHERAIRALLEMKRIGIDEWMAGQDI